MPSSEFVPNQVWGSADAVSSVHELTLPSGQTCQAKKVGIEGLLEMGILDQADSLTAMVNDHTQRVKKNGPSGPETVSVNQGSLMADSNAMKAIIGLADRALPIIVTSPPVALHFSERMVGKTKHTKMLTEAERKKIREERGQPDLVFTDQVGFEDKMWLFDWASGGLKSLASFRGESSADVGSLGNVAKPKGKAKRRPRSN
jgi:hypothetical protein